MKRFPDKISTDSYGIEYPSYAGSKINYL